MPSASLLSRRRVRDLLEAALVVVVVFAATASAPRWVPLLGLTEAWIADARGALLAPAEPRNEAIVVLAIDAASLKPFAYLSPVDRGLIADAVEALGRAGAKAVGLDILFDRPTEPDKDARLHAALRAFPGPAVVAYATAGGGLDADGASFLAAFADGLGKGWPNLLKDARDGTVRWVPITMEGVPEPDNLGFAAAIAHAVGADPTDGPLRIAYRAGPEEGGPPFAIYPIAAASLLPPDWLADRIVLIGAQLTDTDRHRVPRAVLTGAVEGTIPGVLIHAYALAQMLDGRRLAELSPFGNAAVILVAVVLGVGFALARLPWPLLALNLVAAVAAFAGAGVVATLAGGPDLPFATPVLGMLVAFAAGIAFVGRQLRREKRFIREAFARYVAPTVVAALEARPERLVLGGERRELTLLFSDVAGFTALSENLDPQALGALLNRYFDGLCAVVMAHQGTIDKLIGDAIVAIFAAPVAQPDHARRAVHCALAMDEFSEAFRREQSAQGVKFGATRIGINTGQATVGNFGGRDRFNYTALGDTVNTASRLEGANKAFGTRICVSASTVAQCPGVIFRPIGEVVVKGRTDAIKVFEPSDPDLAAYDAAYRLLDAGDAGAEAAFAGHLARFPDDQLAAFHLARLRAGERGVTIVLAEK